MVDASADEARVLVIYTGGTIGMLQGESGYAPVPHFLASNLQSNARFHDPAAASIFSNSTSAERYQSWNTLNESSSGSSTPQSLPRESTSTLKVIMSNGQPKNLPALITPRTAQGKRIRFAILEFDVLIDSAEIQQSDFIEMAAMIERNYTAFDSFVILHGTDTMAYTTSALSFLLEDLGKTVVVTGAQIPLAELLNDSVDNLLGSLIIAGHYRIPEVSLFFNHKLYRGNRAKKTSSEELNAFESPNFAPLAVVGTEIDVAWKSVLRPGPKAFRAHKLMSDRVATLRIFPGISTIAVRVFLEADGIRGVVLETFGAGNAPKREELLSAFREASAKGIVIVNVTQCQRGSVASEIYETGRALRKAGIVSGVDMTVECALAKLCYLLSKNLTPDQIRKMIPISLRGELTPPNAFPTHSSSPEVADRLRTLLGTVIACSGGACLVPESREEGSIAEADWTATTDEDAEKAENALMPFLLAQAASKEDGSLQNLIKSLETSSLLAPEPGSAISHLSESSNASLHTPLHLAVISSSVTNLEVLLQNGANVHGRDFLCHTALYYAARQVGREMVRMLVDAGASLGETEIERGDVGLEILRAEKLGDTEVWEIAAGKDFERAKEVFRKFVA